MFVKLTEDMLLKIEEKFSNLLYIEFGIDIPGADSDCAYQAMDLGEYIKKHAVNIKRNPGEGE